MKGFACAIGILLVGHGLLLGHLYQVHELRSPNNAQRLFLYGDYHPKVSDAVTALERRQLLSLLDACKSYEKSSAGLLLLAEDPVRAYGYSDRILDRGRGLLPGLLNQLDTYDLPGLTAATIETRVVLLAALLVFDYSRFPLVYIDNAVDVRERSLRDVTKFTMEQLFDEIRKRLTVVIAACSSLPKQPEALERRIDGALTAYDALYGRMLCGPEKVPSATTLLSYAIDLACKDLACSNSTVASDLQKEASAVLGAYATLARDEYCNRVRTMVQAWNRVTGSGTYKALGTSRRQLLAALMSVGDALVELGALCAIVQAPREATTILVIAGGDHIKNLLTLLIACGWKETRYKEVAWDQALDPSAEASLFSALYQPTT
jgi:hypothetical protein